MLIVKTLIIQFAKIVHTILTLTQMFCHRLIFFKTTSDEGAVTKPSRRDLQTNMHQNSSAYNVNVATTVETRKQQPLLMSKNDLTINDFMSQIRTSEHVVILIALATPHLLSSRQV